MAKRKKIGIIFELNSGWIAGAYYSLNLIHALNQLNEKEKPEIIILGNNDSDFKYVKDETNYPYLKYRKLKRHFSLILRAINKITRLLISKNLFSTILPVKIKYVFPVRHNNYGDIFKNTKQIIYWIPDFQEHFLPQLFSKVDIQNRISFQKSILYSNSKVVVSSKASLSDLQKIYPDFTAQVFVLPFVVAHPSFDHITEKQIIEKYNLPDKFLYSPNQFWQHKNHIIILKSLKLALEAGTPFHVVFSGIQKDYRNQDYFDSLLEYIEDNKIGKYISILGFIERTEQLKIMQMSYAVIQPSLFEGWSTVIEDAKLLKKKIICSNLAVHYEQLEEQANYFNPDNPEDLLKLINSELISYDSDYKNLKILYAENFIKILEA